ncbi:mycothiol synthase [Georgenia halophila]|uniref:Mycothiol acetyltransferase n=1 Tax=Georgenia halophila TaxID=620889 RepID=A0ABP8KYP7_9MICO
MRTFERLTDEVAGRVLMLAEDVAGHDGVAALSEQPLLELRHPVRDVRHVLVGGDDDPSGALAGYAQLDVVAGSAELAVHPGHRRRGIGRALLDAVRDLAPGVAVWAHGDLPAARALAASADMERVRELLQMAVDLPVLGVPDDTRPAAHGLTRVRTFRSGQDEEAWVRLNARAFSTHPEQGRMTVEDLRARQAEDWFDPSVLWLVPDPEARGGDERLLASMWVKIEPHDGGAPVEGEIYALGVHPDAQGRGLGGRLTSLALAEMAARGLRRATLYVEGDNAPALRTYERNGFRCVATDVQYR